MMKRLWREWRTPMAIGFAWSFGATYGLHLSPPWSWRWLLGFAIVLMAYIAGREETT